MRTLAACSLGGAGHLNPLLPILAAAQRRGDEVLVAAPSGLREMVIESGYGFAPGAEPTESEIAPIREQLPVLPAKEASVLGNRELFGRLAARAMLPAMEGLFQTWRPHMVLRDPSEYASAVVARRAGVPAAQVAISFADVEAGSLAVAEPVLEEHLPGLTQALVEMPYLTRFPASLDPSPFPATIRFREMTKASPEPLPDWWEGRSGPLVYVTFGTVLGYMAEAAHVYRAALTAVEHLDARVLMTVGRKFDPTSLGPLPAHVHVEPWVDQDRALDEAELVLTHCGSGTALGALAAGVPIVAAPLFADQFENSRRIADAGAALIVRGRRNQDRRPHGLLTDKDAPDLTAAIEGVIADRSYRRHAAAIATEMASMPDADGALQQISWAR